MSPKKRIGAIGIVLNEGRYGGTYAHSDIAMSFATRVFPEFQLYIISICEFRNYLSKIGLT